MEAQRQQRQQHTTIVQMHRSDSDAAIAATRISSPLPPRRFASCNTRASLPIVYNDDNDDDNKKDVDDIDGVGQEALQRLLSPQGALATELVKEIVQHLASSERAADLASMSRRRYAVTQCVTVLIALLAVATVVLVTVCNNDVLNELLLQALNATTKAFAGTEATTAGVTDSGSATPPSYFEDNDN
jgi:hypothetical protein